MGLLFLETQAHMQNFKTFFSSVCFSLLVPAKKNSFVLQEVPINELKR